jgi:BlaI family penicillinase repressor
MTHVVNRLTGEGRHMREPKLSRLEFTTMEVLWEQGPCAIRDILAAFPAKKKPAYTTIQTVVYRMEAKNIVRRVKKVGNFHIFEALISRKAAQRRLIDELLAFFGGSSQPVVAHLIESGKLSLEEIEEAEKMLRTLSQKGKCP